MSMPQHGHSVGDSLRVSHESASRKRSYEQITRSASRSITPAPAPKRRRTLPSDIRTSSATTEPHDNEIADPGRLTSLDHSSTVLTAAWPQRFVGDGLDFRRPTASAMAQAAEHSTIDLTLDDDSDGIENGSAQPDAAGSNQDHRPSDRTSPQPDQSQIATPNARRSRSGRTRTRAPPFGHLSGIRSQSQAEVIDISSGEEEEEDDDDDDDIVQITGARPVSRPVLPPIRDLLDRRVSTPPPELRRADAQTFADTIRNRVSDLLTGPWLNRAPDAIAHPFYDRARAFLGRDDRISLEGRMGVGIGIRTPAPLDLTTYDSMGDMDDYDNLTMDYGTAAFVIEDPGQGQQDDDVEEMKMSTLPTRAGFTRDLEENGDVLVCVNCEDELACTDDDELKQQVWVSKKCGHVFCGICASRRAMIRGGNDRDRKRTKRPKTEPIKECCVKDCNTKFTSKGALIQIYL